MTQIATITGQSRSSSTADQLRAHILRGSLLPGEHLTQAELAQRFNMSKVPVREALKQLHAEGFLSHDHNRGYFVSPLSHEEAMQLYKMRRWVESELLATARWPTSAELAALRKLSEKVTMPVSRANREEWVAALGELRRAIFALSTKKILYREAVRLWNLTDRYRAILPDDKSMTGEKKIIDCLEKKDRENLLEVYHEDRDRIESILEDSLPVGMF